MTDHVMRGHGELVRQLYREILGRDADEAGLLAWSQVADAQGADAVRRGLTDSVEYAARLARPDGTLAPRPSRDDVIAAYRLFLDRAPESEDVIASHLALPDRIALIERLAGSDEFREVLRGRSVGGLDEMLAASGPRYVLTEAGPSRRYWINLRDRHVSMGILNGCWEPGETRFVETHVRPDMRVLDIGANLGWFTIIMAERVGAEGHVTAFEPRRDIHACLRRTVEANGCRNVTLHEVALGAEDGVMDLVWDLDDANPGGTRLDGADPAGRSGRTIAQPTQVRRLDAVVRDPVDFIKIDVEGAEKLVLDGARALLRRKPPVILSELCPRLLREVSGIEIGAYFGYLTELGYQCWTLDSSGQTRAPITAWPHEDDRDLISVVLRPG